ncbi:hypothetical protein NT6N_31280 [Oceaniferula spumae]|uniref:TIGR03790 family protein n=1 Tax=Oceaniferula spumae TaxID=2979115 RepID=A0AAT9FQ34_9BACT
MKIILTLIVSLLAMVRVLAAPISPESVIVLYNSAIPESKTLADYYAKMRGIPADNMVGLELSTKDEITREEYDDTIRMPLTKLMVLRGFWKMGANQQGVTLPVASKITTMVCMRGVPFKIKRSPVPQPPAQKLPAQFANVTEACVDSELSMFGVSRLPIAGPINNPYFKKETGIADAKLPYIVLVGRIDGPDYDTCKRMIDDAILTERQGLWGMCYLDKSLKGGGFAIGDEWLDNIARLNDEIGIPTAMDSNKQTFTTNYPMNDAALYFGWYTGHKNGPLLNPAFQFRRGAIAVHLHSFSASKLRDAKSHWTGPILAHGAAGTVGNVYEPYLQLTHYFDILHSRLIKGYSLVEASYMSLPYLSWQNVVLGDPLYRPFLHLEGGGEVEPDDRDFRAIRVANQRWGKEPETMVKKLRTAAAAKGNARFYEYLGLWYRVRNQDSVATAFFQTASKKHLKEADRLRQWIYTADLQRQAGQKAQAIATLRKARELFPNIPETKSVVGLLNILDPPPPPPAKKQPEKTPAAPKKAKKGA